MSAIPLIDAIPKTWSIALFRALFRENSTRNDGIGERNLLSLSYGCIIQKDIASADGLLPASFGTYQIVEPDDLILRLTDLQNDKKSLRTALVTQRGIITSAYLGVKPIGLDARFAAYTLRSYDTMKIFYSLGGGVRQSLKYSDLARMPMLVPPPAPQVAIADYLDRETAQIDALIAKQEQLIATLRERRLQVLRHEIDRLREVPWTQIRHLASVLNGGTPTSDAENWDGDVPFATPADLRPANGAHLSSASRSLTSRGVASGSSVAPKGSVLISTRAPIGYASVLDCDMAFNQGCRALVPGAEIGSDFLMLMMFGLADALSIEGRGTTFMEVSSGQIEAFRIPAPSLEHQHEMVDRVTRSFARIDALIAKAERFIELSKERRAALITAAVTGQIDVGESAA